MSFPGDESPPAEQTGPVALPMVAPPPVVSDTAQAPAEPETGPDAAPAAQESAEPMLDIHVPRPTHTWKDFFIHIATIVVGLLIAIGLEQTVVFFEHRHQLQDARADLLREVQDNLQLVELNIAATQKTEAALEADIALLRAPHAAHAQLARQLDYHWSPNDTQDGRWQAAKQDGALSLMPHEELRQYAHVYAVLGAFMDNLPAFGERMEVAAAIVRRSGDGELSAAEIQELMSATSEAQGRLALQARLLHYAQLGLKGLLTLPPAD